MQFLLPARVLKCVCTSTGRGQPRKDPDTLTPCPRKTILEATLKVQEAERGTRFYKLLPCSLRERCRLDGCPSRGTGGEGAFGNTCAGSSPPVHSRGRCTDPRSPRSFMDQRSSALETCVGRALPGVIPETTSCPSHGCTEHREREPARPAEAHAVLSFRDGSSSYSWLRVPSSRRASPWDGLGLSTRV